MVLQMNKEMWIAAYDDLYQAALETGKSEKEAERVAENGAESLAIDRLADHADNLRKRAKEEA